MKIIAVLLVSLLFWLGGDARPRPKPKPKPRGVEEILYEAAKQERARSGPAHETVYRNGAYVYVPY